MLSQAEYFRSLLTPDVINSIGGVIRSHNGFLCSCFLEQACKREPFEVQRAATDIAHLAGGHLSLAVVNGQLMFSPDDDAIGRVFKKNDFNKFESHCTRLFLHSGDDALDIGGNVGGSTVVIAKAVGGGKVVTLEPERANFALLKKNLILNGVTNVTAHQIAAGDSEGVAPLYLNDDKGENNCGDHRVWADPNESRKSYKVPQFPADLYTNTLLNLRFIKIDTQGAEVKVLRGLKSALAKYEHLVLQVEYWPWGLKNCGNSHVELLDILTANGFLITCMDTSQTSLVRTPREALEGYIMRGVPFDKILLDLWCFRGNSVDRLMAAGRAF